jgi:hypothetical protein
MKLRELGPACLRHRATLLALVDRQERGPATESALEHLMVCRRCEDELTRLALTIQALRRIGQAAAAAPPPDAVWPRLRAHLERSRRHAREAAWRWRLNLGGVMAGTLIVGVLVGPLAIHVNLGANGGHEPTGYSSLEDQRYSVQVEARFLESSMTGPLPSTRKPTSVWTSGLRVYPDGIRPGWKEVEPSQPDGQPSQRASDTIVVS